LPVLLEQAGPPERCRLTTTLAPSRRAPPACVRAGRRRPQDPAVQSQALPGRRPHTAKLFVSPRSTG